MYVTQILDFANSQILQNLLPIGFNFNWDLIGKGSMEAQYGRVVSSKVVSVVVCYFYVIPFKMKPEGSGCGSVGRAVASDTRGPRFESSHRQNLLNICSLSTVY